MDNRKKVLVVDDNKLNIELLKEILEGEGYILHTLNKGSDVLKMAKSIKPDAILLDVMMPDIGGFEVCEILKSDYNTEDIPVLMITARTEKQEIKKAFDIGAFDYIKKPINEVEVIARLKSALQFKEEQERLKEMAMKDGLTDLYNHALLLELFEQEYNKVYRQGNSIVFLMIDLDHFKKINDQYGHTVGDQVLSELATILKENTRQSDIVGRYGGEEFGIVLADTSLKDTAILASRIRRAIEEHIFAIEGNRINITASIGFCFKYPDNSTNYREMIKAADKALYQAKENGRNRVESIVLE